MLNICYTMWDHEEFLAKNRRNPKTSFSIALWCLGRYNQVFSDGPHQVAKEFLQILKYSDCIMDLSLCSVFFQFVCVSSICILSVI